MDPTLYFDVNGSSPLSEEVRATFVRSAREDWGNPSAGHPAGLRARTAIDRARAVLATALGAHEDEVLFTSGATESNNWVLAALDELAGSNRRHVVVSSIEHKSVLSSASALERRGFEVTRLEVDEGGAVDPDRLEAVLRPGTALVAVMLANNETGVLQPARDVAALCRDRGALYLCDAVAAYGRVPVDVARLGCDFLSLSSHKLYAPKGTGVLVARHGALERAGFSHAEGLLPPWMHGCGQQRGLRGGTENTAGIVALARAVELLAADPAGPARLAGLRDRLWRGLLELCPTALRNGRAPFLPNTLSVALPGRSGAELQRALGARGVSVGVGAAGALGAPSHVLQGMGLDADRARSTLRFSLGVQHDAAAIDRLLELLAELLLPQTSSL